MTDPRPRMYYFQLYCFFPKLNLQSLFAQCPLKLYILDKQMLFPPQQFSYGNHATMAKTIL